MRAAGPARSAARRPHLEEGAVADGPLRGQVGGVEEAVLDEELEGDEHGVARVGVRACDRHGRRVSDVRAENGGD